MRKPRRTIVKHPAPRPSGVQGVVSPVEANVQGAAKGSLSETYPVRRPAANSRPDGLVFPAWFERRDRLCIAGRIAQRHSACEAPKAVIVLLNVAAHRSAGTSVAAGCEGIGEAARSDTAGVRRKPSRPGLIGCLGPFRKPERCMQALPNSPCAAVRRLRAVCPRQTPQRRRSDTVQARHKSTRRPPPITNVPLIALAAEDTAADRNRPTASPDLRTMRYGGVADPGAVA